LPDTPWSLLVSRGDLFTSSKTRSTKPSGAQGLKSHGRKLRRNGSEKQRQGDPQQGLLIVEEGLEILSTHPGLLSLQSMLYRELEASSKPKQEDKKTKKPRRVWGTF